MPLAFDSRSHGTIAFGFFNIESDMLLCDRYFFFADDFCRKAGDMAQSTGDRKYRVSWTVQVIEEAEDIGDLMGAIHGLRFTGFIGELYRCFPFPQRKADFKQNPDGFQTRSRVSEIIAKYAYPREVSVAVDHEKLEFEIGAYRFGHIQFQELIKYVWRGGYPRWKDGLRPAYVSEMKQNVISNCGGVFGCIDFSG